LEREAFGFVVLDRRKGSKKADANHLVAIKVVGSETASTAEICYIHREIDTLKRINPSEYSLID
jgi:hypothetical protein